MIWSRTGDLGRKMTMRSSRPCGMPKVLRLNCNKKRFLAHA